MCCIFQPSQRARVWYAQRRCLCKHESRELLQTDVWRIEITCILSRIELYVKDNEQILDEVLDHMMDVFGPKERRGVKWSMSLGFFSDGVESGGVTRDMLMGSSQHTRRRLTSSTITKTGARTMIYMHFLTIREIVLCWFGTAICVSGETESIFSFNHCQPFVRSNWSLARLQLKKSPCQTVFSVRLLRIPAFNPPHMYIVLLWRTQSIKILVTERTREKNVLSANYWPRLL